MLKFVIVFLCLQAPASLAAPGVNTVITPELKHALMKNDMVNIFITLQAGTSQIITEIKSSRFLTRSDKLNNLYSELRKHSQKSQKPILDFLSSRPHQRFTVKSFWITNQIFITNADAALISEIESRFSHLLLSIDEEFFAHLIQPVSIQTNVTLNSQEEELQWGIKKIQAPEAWKHLGGTLNAGDGVIVATIDTGVRGTHEALRDNFVGDYGWFDPSTATPFPTDNNGHGTHTAGTIAGGRGIGVAPQAKWAACRGCGVFCAQSHLLACGEFFLCPTLPDGSNPDCSRAPHLISNSWGGGRGNTWYNGVIEAWHTAGIIPLFSIGNSGPICNTADSPGDQNVIGVGSTMDNDGISTFSSVGPTHPDGRMKPEISAPGSNIISAYHTADDAYASISGTSMAAPHAAGSIALLKTRNKDLSYQQAKNLLLGNADENLRFSGRVCGGIRDDVFPNNVFGYGRINALKSIQAQTEILKTKH